MAIKIGNNNKINRTIIAENSTMTEEELGKKNLFTKHPLLSTVIFTVISGLITGLILMFSFWQQFIKYIEKIFGG